MGLLTLPIRDRDGIVYHPNGRANEMGVTTHIKATVLPGNKIEVPAPEYAVGQTVDVTVMWPEAEPNRRRSALEILDSLPGGQMFKTAEEVDRYIEEERNSWDF